MTDHEKIKCINLLDGLRENEGASVDIICKNPGFSGPNEKIVVVDDFTHWQAMPFTGDNLLECLEKATLEKASRTKHERA